MLGEQRGDRAGVVAMTVHAHRQGLEPSQHEPAVERARHRARGVLYERELLGELVIATSNEPTDDVGVAAEILRRGVHDDVGAELQRLLQVRRGERVVDNDLRAPRVGQLDDRRDVDDREHRIRRRLDPHQPRVVAPRRAECVERGEIRGGPGRACRSVDLRHQTERATVRVVGQHDALSRREQPEHRVFRGHAAREREAVLRAFERREARFERRACGVRAARVLVALVHADLGLHERRAE